MAAAGRQRHQAAWRMKPEAMKLGRSFLVDVVVSISPLRKLLHNLSQHQRKRSPLPLRRYNSRLARG